MPERCHAMSLEVLHRLEMEVLHVFVPRKRRLCHADFHTLHPRGAGQKKNSPTFFVFCFVLCVYLRMYVYAYLATLLPHGDNNKIHVCWPMTKFSM